MTDGPTTEFGNTQALTHMLDSMRKGELEIIYSGKPLAMGGKLGEGGTKTVYEAVIGDSNYALAVPNTVDGVERMTQKWMVALQEPANTERVKAIGFFANPTCKALPVSINGVSFTALQMTRYQDLPYQIMDGKNSRSSTVTKDVLPSGVDGDSFEEYFAHIVPDIQRLIQNSVRVGGDSINVCLVDGQPRIFLSDLGNVQFEAFSEEQIPAISEMYVAHALSAFINGLTEAEYRKHKAFLESEHFKFNNPDNVTQGLSKRVQTSISGNSDSI
jgi:hypothetical protein